jgi:uncharacterized membrane protein
MSTGRLEQLIGIVFRVGITVSSTCLAAGLLLSLSGMAGAAAALLLQAGLLVLLATPATRVVVSVVEYVIERDWTFTLLTLIVLAELVASAFAAMAR